VPNSYMLGGKHGRVMLATGLYRIKGNPNMVQVQFGPFSRPITEAAYMDSAYSPRLEELPWQSQNDKQQDSENADRT
jgi:hypothetical protein